MIPLSLEDDAFLSTIHNTKLHSRYRKRLKEELSKTRKQYRNQAKKLQTDQSNGISDNEDHDQIVNMSLYPFVEKTAISENLGYTLRYCDPLQELGLRNFDFLIAKTTTKRVTAIFGEAKTTFAKAPSIIREVKEKKAIVDTNLSYITENYLGKTQLPIDIECVVSVYPQFVDDIQDALEQSFDQDGPGDKTKIVVWKADPHNSMLDIANPGRSTPHRLRMLHAENALNKELTNLEVPRKVLTFFPQSHAATKVKSLITLLEFIKATTGGTEFTAAQVDHFLGSELYYLNEEARRGFRKEILRNAEQVGFIESKGFDRYDVKKVYSGASLRGETIEKLWISHRMKEERNKRIEETRLHVQNEIRAEYDKEPRIEKYFGTAMNRQIGDNHQ